MNRSGQSVGLEVDSRFHAGEELEAVVTTEAVEGVVGDHEARALSRRRHFLEHAPLVDLRVIHLQRAQPRLPVETATNVDQPCNAQRR